MRTHIKAFTLVELLIVVAIIAILSSVAAVNYQHAQARSKVSVVKNDLRVLTGAIESYRVDHNAVPPAGGVGEYWNEFGYYTDPVSRRLFPLTTPVSYISSLPPDAFPTRGENGYGMYDLYDTYDYVNADATPDLGSALTSGAEWRLCSPGPDKFMAFGGRTVTDTVTNSFGVDYDPTNGTMSRGDIVKVGAICPRYGDPRDPANPNRPGILRVPTYIEQWNQ